MSEEKQTKRNHEELLAKIKELEHKIDSLNKNKLVDSEDQLFFGIIISVLFLFITLPIDSFASFLQSTLNMQSSDALQVAQNIRYLGLGLSVISALTRYYAVIGDQRVSKRYRYVSLEALLFALSTISVIIMYNISSAIPDLGVFKVSPLVSIHIDILIAVLAEAFVIILLSYFEKGLFNLYIDKKILTKKYAFPLSSCVWLSFIFGIFCANIFALTARQMGADSQLYGVVFFFSLMIGFILFSFYYTLNWSNTREKNNKPNDFALIVYLNLLKKLLINIKKKWTGKLKPKQQSLTS